MSRIVIRKHLYIEIDWIRKQNINYPQTDNRQPDHSGGVVYNDINFNIAYTLHKLHVIPHTLPCTTC